MNFAYNMDCMEAMRQMGFPLGWTDLNASETP